MLHIHEPFVPSLGWSAMNHAECPIVSTFHANSERFFWYWLGKPILKRVFPVFDGVVAVSPAARDTAARYFAGQFRVIPNGIDLTRFCAPGAAPRRPAARALRGRRLAPQGPGRAAARPALRERRPAAVRARRLRQRRARREVLPPRARALRRARALSWPYRPRRAARALPGRRRLLRALARQRVVRHRPARGDGHADGRAGLGHRRLSRRGARRRRRPARAAARRARAGRRPRAPAARRASCARPARPAASRA